MKYLLLLVIVFNQSPNVRERVLADWNGEVSVVELGNKFYVLDTNGNRKLFYEDKTNCRGQRALFLNRNQILVATCKEHFVSDRNGTRLYKLPHYIFPDYAVNKEGTLLAVLERGMSWRNEFSKGSIDKVRLLVHTAANGKKVFEKKIIPAPHDRVELYSIRFADDASILLVKEVGEARYHIGPRATLAR